MPTDAELLQLYVRARDERAFTTLVQRHLNLVYAAALRRTNGRTQLAEEVVQKVFTDLARKASSLQTHPALTGWLYRSTRYTAIDATRREIRHQNLLRSFTTMTDDSTQPEPQAHWESLRPVIDEAMDELNEADREVMLLRYFNGLSFAEVGERMDLTENTARMRVERALDKLRVRLGKRGVTSTAAALNGLLANQIFATAPAGLASSVTTAALAMAPAGAVASLLGVLALNRAAAIGIGAGLVAGIGAVAWSLAQARASQNELTMLRAENTKLSAMAATTWERSVLAAPAGILSESPVPEAQAVEDGGHRDRGQATAENAFLSYAWALDTGNADALAELVTFDETGRDVLMEIYAKVPEAMRMRYRTPEALIVHARLVSAVLNPPPGVEVLRKFVATEAGSGRVVLRQIGSSGKGWALVLTPDGWKVELPLKRGSEVGLLRLLNNEIVVKLGLN